MYSYRHTLYASYIGYITQAIINNLAPLLFVTFQKEFSISIERIGLLISINFGVQIITDIIAAKYADKAGYRTAAVIAHVFSFAGLLSMGILPFVFSNPYRGLLVAIVLNGMGGGLIEVLISPIVESLPGNEKASAMSLLHSFYCWGHVLVVLLSTVYFAVVGINKWYYLPMIWSLIPAFNIFLFSKVPLRKLVEDEHRDPIRKILKQKFFWLFFILMVCAGAAEQAMSQWSSLFAELGLGVSKTVGDLFGPSTFAVLMGLSRTFYGIRGSKINLENTMLFSGILCVISYALAIFSAHPVVSLAGCGLCGLSVGMMWPGTLSLASKHFSRGGTAMFAFLALAGDMGCSSGPGLVGFVSGLVQKGALSWLRGMFLPMNAIEAGLKTGLLIAVLFPLIMLAGLFLLKKKTGKQSVPD